MRVLLICTGFVRGTGGVEEAVRRLARYLVAHDHEVVVLVSAPPGAFRFRTEQVDGVTIGTAYLNIPTRAASLVARLLFPLRVLYSLSYIALLLRRGRPDVINLHFAGTATAYALMVAKLFKIPLIVSLHGSDVFILPEQYALYHRLLTLALRHATALTASSPALLAYLCSHYAVETAKIDWMPNGLEATSFTSDRSTTGEPAVEYRPYILAVARLVQLKAIDVAIRAFAQLRRKHPDHRFVIAGDGPEMASLQTLTVELQLQDSVVFLGLRPNDAIPALMVGCELLVLPSKSESFPLVLLEAMAAGRPIVATRVGGVPDAVVDGQCAILVPPEDPELLAGAMATLLDDAAMRQKFGEFGRRRAQEMFSMERIGDQYVAIYRRSVAL
jgi:glycosyltransferase involved in cell wall biosynthesis